MELFLIDNVVTITQLLTMVCVINYCIEGTRNQGEKYFILSYIFCTSIYIIISNGMFSEILMYIFNIILCTVIYKEERSNAILSYSIVYLLEVMFTMIIKYIYIMSNYFGIHPYIKVLYFLYFFELIIQVILYSLRYKIKLVCIILQERNSKALIWFVDIASIFAMFECLKGVESVNSLAGIQGEVLFALFFVTIIISLVYIIKVKIQSKSIEELNLELQKKNNGLRKIKHDYGAQISYLYGLYLLRRYDELEKELSKIQEVNRMTTSAVEVGQSNDNILSKVIRQTLDNGIHIIVDDSAEYNNMEVDEDTIVNLVVDIINKEMKLLKESSVILVHTYNSLGRVIIDIKNENLECDSMMLEELFKSKKTIKSIFIRRKMIISEMKERVDVNYRNKVKLKVYFKSLGRRIKVRIIIK